MDSYTYFILFTYSYHVIPLQSFIMSEARIQYFWNLEYVPFE
jgi:hypothetical protein